ncbi:MAG TPA: ABC transporter [Clostridiales bacterium]|nr:ABC transporter [Clostridiales bacterium]
MLEMNGVTKTFGSFKALDNLNLTVPQGAVYGLVGPNGAGKSTAIRHLTGVYRPDSGTVQVDSQRVYENPAVKADIGYIPDEVFYFPSATMEDMRRFYKGLYPRFDDDLYNRLYDIFRLPKNGQIRRFSKGMQKQAAFHLALAMRPKVLILDEPVDGLDPVMRRQVMSLILSDVAEYGTTVLISSHNLRELEDVCDHVGIMDHGQMLLEKSLADMQGTTHKLQIVGGVPEGLEILHESSSGRLKTLICRGQAWEISTKAAAAKPAYFDVLPLSLEEIFIYELGGADYAVKDILL